MGRLVAVCLGVLVLATLGWLLLGGDADAPSPESAGVQAVGSASPATAADEPRRRRAQPVPAAPEPEPEPDDDDEERVERILRVLGPGDKPLEGVPFGHSEWWFGGPRHTDEKGEMVFRTLPEIPVVVTSPLNEGKVRLLEPVTVVRLEDVHPVTLRLVDLETGAPLDVGWKGTGHGVTSEWPAGWARPGATVRVSLPLVAPEGWHWPATPPSLTLGRASKYAEGYVATIAVARELQLAVRVERHDGRPAVGARVRAVTHDDRGERYSTAETGESGAVTMKGLPFRRGETLRVSARWMDPDEFEHFSGIAEPVRLVDPHSQVSATVLVASEPDDDLFRGPPDNSTIGVGGELGDAEVDEVPRDASLHLRVTRGDGRPARGASVLLRGIEGREGRADEDGVVLFEGLPAGRYAVSLLEPGLVPTVRTVSIARGERVNLALREAKGRSASVVVVDAEGEPLPGASVSVSLSTWSYAHVVDGVHHLTVLTDAAGRCVLHGLPADAPIRVRARYGSRSADARRSQGEAFRIVIPNAD